MITAQILFEEAFNDVYHGDFQTVSVFSREPPWLWDDEMIGVYEKHPGNIVVTPTIPPTPESAELRNTLKNLGQRASNILRNEGYIQ